jgi:hypothetical protein
MKASVDRIAEEQAEHALHDARLVSVRARCGRYLVIRSEQLAQSNFW